jgi:hypothetical protein
MGFSNVVSVMGGGAPHYLTEYYRGGPYTPAQFPYTAREPSSGGYYSSGSYEYTVGYEPGGKGYPSWQGTYIVWAGTVILNVAGPEYYSYTSGGYTYYPDSLYSGIVYYVYRTYTAYYDVNTNVPTSGSIRLSNFYGAVK